MLSLNSHPDQNRTSPAEKLFGHKLRTTLPSLIPFFQSATTKKHTITQNLRCKLPETAPGTTVRIRTGEQKLSNKRGIVASQNNCPWSYDNLNERGNILSRNRRHLIPTTEKFNIKYDYDNAIPVSNTSTHPNLMIDNWHQKTRLENVCRTKSGDIVKGAVTDMRYFARSKFSRTLVHKKNFSLIWKVRFKLGYVFCQQER